MTGNRSWAGSAGDSLGVEGQENPQQPQPLDGAAATAAAAPLGRPAARCFGTELLIPRACYGASDSGTRGSAPSASDLS